MNTIGTYGISASNKALDESVVGKQTLGKNDFLKLLVAQLEHQDPLKPVDNSAFVAQLAQFSTLEGINNMDKDLKGVGDAIVSKNNYQATSFIGREAGISSDTVVLEKGKTPRMGYMLDRFSKEVGISILDGEGRVIRTMIETGRPQGINAFTWDGKDNSGNEVVPGQYHFSVTTLDNTGSPVPAATLATGLVDGIAFDKGTPYLLVNGRRRGLDEVIGIWGRK